MANIDNLLTRALQLHRAGKLLEARVLYGQILEEFPTHAKTLNLLGASYIPTREHQKGLPFLEKALAIKPDFPEAHNNLGTALKALNRHEEAIACYLKALAIKPDYALAYYNLGLALKELNRHEEAIVSYQMALAIKPDYVDAYNNLGIALSEAQRHEEAINCFQKLLLLRPHSSDAYNNLGIALEKLNRHEESLSCFQKALAIKPDYADAYYNLAKTLDKVQRYEESIASYQKALALKPDNADTYNNLGDVLCKALRYDEATACFRKVLSIKPDYAFASGQYIHSKQHCCDWGEFDETSQAILNGIDSGEMVSIPFPLLSIPSSPAQQKQCAESWVREKHPETSDNSNVGIRYTHNKIRLAYVSADLREHPVGQLIVGVFEQHDKSRFETVAISLGIDDKSQIRARMLKAFDKFVDASQMGTAQIAQLMRDLEIDIAVDLSGLTSGSRTDIFALRPAPIQVNYLGYPGTMGAPYIDYLIADPTLIPVAYQRHYTEKIAYLPDTYQANDSRRLISERQFTRSEAGLPEQGFVFCCFNNNFKITPAVFDIWMHLLMQAEGSVLWLLEGNALVTQNLRNEAMKRGIALERIVFAKRMHLSEHLSRQRLADLFLDTFFYNAHTTTSDALWAGLPVLTCLGDTFAGRVAASLLNAIGLPELITHSHEEYQALALELATTPEKLASIKRKLAQNRLTHPLFNTALFTRHIEDAFTQMWKKHQDSLLPDHIYVRANK